MSSRRTSGHRYIQTIHTYYEGCNTQNIDLMCSTFTDDVVHYFVDHSAVRGAAALANYWARTAPRTGANWQLDHAVVQEPEAVIEWSMLWVPPKTSGTSFVTTVSLRYGHITITTICNLRKIVNSTTSIITAGVTAAVNRLRNSGGPIQPWF